MKKSSEDQIKLAIANALHGKSDIETKQANRAINDAYRNIGIELSGSADTAYCKFVAYHNNHFPTVANPFGAGDIESIWQPLVEGHPDANNMFTAERHLEEKIEHLRNVRKSNRDADRDAVLKQAIQFLHKLYGHLFETSDIANKEALFWVGTSKGLVIEDENNPYQ